MKTTLFIERRKIKNCIVNIVNADAVSSFVVINVIKLPNVIAHFTGTHTSLSWIGKYSFWDPTMFQTVDETIK